MMVKDGGRWKRMVKDGRLMVKDGRLMVKDKR